MSGATEPCRMVGKFCANPTHWPGPRHEVDGVPCHPGESVSGATEPRCTGHNVGAGYTHHGLASNCPKCSVSGGSVDRPTGDEPDVDWWVTACQHAARIHELEAELVAVRAERDNLRKLQHVPPGATVVSNDDLTEYVQAKFLLRALMVEPPERKHTMTRVDTDALAAARLWVATHPETATDV